MTELVLSRLASCENVTVAIRLEVRTQERKWVNSPESFRSTDQEAGTVTDFCRRHNIPCSGDFVSVWAMPANSNQIKQLGGGRSTWIFRNADCYGKEIIVLGEQVVDSLALVASGDFQNIILEATKLEVSRKDMETYLNEMLCVFTLAMARDERIARLECASAKARYLIKLGDAEARLLRPLRNSDKQDP